MWVPLALPRGICAKVRAYDEGNSPPRAEWREMNRESHFEGLCVQLNETLTRGRIGASLQEARLGRFRVLAGLVKPRIRLRLSGAPRMSRE